MHMHNVNDLIRDVSPYFYLAMGLEASVIVNLMGCESNCATFSVYDLSYFVAVMLHVVCLQELLHFPVPDSIWLDVVEENFFI